MNQRIVKYLIGIVILALGIRFIVDANQGAAPWDLLCIGLFKQTGISIGSWQIINNVAMIVLTKLLFKEKWNIVCLLPGVLLGLCIDAIGLGFDASGIPSYLGLVIGCMLSGIGLVIYMNQGFSANAIDNFTFTLSLKKETSTSVAKFICDAIPLVMILLLQIRIQLGTIFVYVLVPLCMQLTQKIFKVKVKR